MSADSKLMKRSFSTIGDQCVNGLWQEQHSLERISPDGTYRPRQRSYRGHLPTHNTYSLIYIYNKFYPENCGIQSLCFQDLIKSQELNWAKYMYLFQPFSSSNVYYLVAFEWQFTLTFGLKLKYEKQRILTTITLKIKWKVVIT